MTHSLRVCSLDEIGEMNWLSFISSRESSIYHHPLWHRAIEATYGIKPVYAVTTDSSGVMNAAVPGALLRSVSGAKRFVSFPFSDVCGPVADSAVESAAIVSALGQEFTGKPWSRSEIRVENGLPYEGYSEYQGYSSHVLALGRPADEIFSSFHGDCVQRKIKKAFKSGLEVYEGISFSDMKEFYRLHLMTRKKLGAPVQPFSFFRNILGLLGPAGKVTIIIVRKGKQAVSALVMLKHGKRASYKFAASDESFLKLGSNQLAIWTAIRKASDEGFLEFDFGRSHAANRGLADFKARWGAKEVRLCYLRSPGKAPGVMDEGGKCARLASTVFKNIPRLSNRLIGRLFYKYLA